MEPHLVRWHNELKDRGLTVIEIDHGGRDSLDDMKQHVARANIPFAVLHDDGGTVCDKYGVKAFPAAYLLDRSGKVVWEGHPASDPSGAKRQIEQLLEAAANQNAGSTIGG